MRRWIGCAGLILMLLFAAGLFITWNASSRLNQSRVYCQRNLMELHQASELIGQSIQPGAVVAGPWAPGTLKPRVLAGTIPNANLPPDRRLSWIVSCLPAMDQRRENPVALYAKIDLNRARDEEPNSLIGHKRLPVLTCPANPRDIAAGQPSVTQYLGMAGVDPGAAELGLDPPISPRAGCFRYDQSTPYTAIRDGLSNTILFAETNADLGPWMQGGPSTVRGLNDSPDAKPVVGVAGQFGGNHPEGGGNFGMADGSVRFLTERMDRTVFRGLVTIAGGMSEKVPGED